MLKFDGDYNGSFIELNWKTGLETNNDHFVVERRHESERDFKEIGQVDASDLPNLTRHEYEFDDFDLTKQGLYYYRIKQVEKNGRYTYSHVISIQVLIDNELSVSLHPNPVKDILIIELSLPNDTEVDAMVIDRTGNIVIAKPFGGFMSAIRHHIILRTAELSSGIYVLRIQTNAGIIHKQFTVVR